MKRFIASLVSFSLLFTQTFALAGHEDGIASGQAVVPLIRSRINTPSAERHVPGYTTAPPQTSLHRAPNLSGQANTHLAACLSTPDDPACQAQLNAITSANTPRPAVGPHDPSVAAARHIASHPNTVLGNLATYYAGCTTSAVTVPTGTVNRMCNRYTGIGAYACRRELTVDIQMNPSCEVGDWFAQAQTSHGGADRMHAQAQCRIGTDDRQRFQFHALGDGACTGWQAAWLPKTPISEATEVTDLSPRFAGRCQSPFKVIAMPGSGCTGGACNYTFQFGTPVYECPAGAVPGDRIYVGWSGDTPMLGAPNVCYSSTRPPSGGDLTSDCPAGTLWLADVDGEYACVREIGPGRLTGASGWTLPLSFEEPHMNIVQTDRWDDRCPVLAAESRCAMVSGERCVDGPGTKIIGGTEVTRDCWAHERTLSCASGAGSDECAPLAAAGCTPSSSTCVNVDPVTGSCAQHQDTYQCPSVGETVTTTSNCPTEVFCLGTSCFNIAHANDTDFARSMTYMEAAREAGVYMDMESLRVFKGEANRCRNRLLRNCCNTDSAGAGMTNQNTFGTGSRLVYDVLMNSENRAFITQGLQALMTGSGMSGTFSTYGVTFAVNGAALPAGSTVLYSSSAVAGEGLVVAFDPWSLVIAVIIYVVMSAMSCDSQEGRLALQRGARLCHEVGNYCSSRFLGSCVTRTHTHCCFNSVLSRIINEQGRPLVGRGWGDVRSPNCDGFTVAELQSLNFAAMDFSEFYASIVPVLPDVAGMRGSNASRVPACYHGQGRC